ncbi:ABC transporter ATP-binding protein [Candidatus Aerophobetes bacterium]|uniref:ABC transporter ATP-binding protein n=1 Tax=Aerophobetes bacterium TaxID=2030807 RepID=A0A497E4P5_UNCAE|nr:MAG: ABC transporter ATP-binding protein [Candidatus Aerophobetes bacterium]
MKNKSALLLQVKNLKTYFYLDEGVLKAVDDVSFKIQKKMVLGVVGESGCGKSVTAQSILRIVPDPGKIVEGEIFLHQDGKVTDLVKLDPYGKEIRAIRGKEITMIFQEPMTSLSPVHTIGDQIMEAILLHRNMNKNEAKELTLEMLYKVGIPNPYQRINEYPHQLSGGLRQRAMIAMALSCNPSLLIADEPTTALDVTVQAQILELMKELQAEFGMSIMFITHNLGVIAEVSDEVMVMYLGKAVEYASVDEIFHNPLHPYTVRLLRSIPKVGKKARTRLDAIKGTVPLPLDLPPGCSFYPRCPEAKKGLCNKEDPSLVEVKKGHWVSCFLYK